MKILGYARVSSREQAENSHALEQQIERLKSAGATEILFDVDSGSRDDRQAFNQMLDLVRTAMVSGVVVTRLDRLTRSVVTLRNALKVFDSSGIPLQAMDDSINTGTAAGKFHLNILGALAEMEVDRLSERVKHGWAHLRDRKVAMNPPFGYAKVDNKHALDHEPFLCLLACPVEPLIDRRKGTIVELPVEWSQAIISNHLIDAFLQHRTLRRTIRWLNETFGIYVHANNNQPGKRMGGRTAQQMFRFSPGGFRDWLTNPVLQGHLCYLRKRENALKGRTQIIPNTHPEHRLITDEEIAAIERILKHNAVVRGYGSTALKYPLSGLVFCGECRGLWYSIKGGRGKNQPGSNYYFQCKNWRTRGCTQKSMIRMEFLEESVIQALQERAAAIAQIASVPPEQQEPVQLKELRQQLLQLEQIPGRNAAIDKAKKQIRVQIEQFSLQQNQKHHLDAGNRELLLTALSDEEYWETLPDKNRQEIYRALIKRIIVKNAQIERIEFNV